MKMEFILTIKVQRRPLLTEYPVATFVAKNKRNLGSHLGVNKIMWSIGT